MSEPTEPHEAHEPEGSETRRRALRLHRVEPATPAPVSPAPDSPASASPASASPELPAAAAPAEPASSSPAPGSPSPVAPAPEDPAPHPTVHRLADGESPFVFPSTRRYDRAEPPPSTAFTMPPTMQYDRSRIGLPPVAPVRRASSDSDRVIAQAQAALDQARGVAPGRGARLKKWGLRLLLAALALRVLLGLVLEAAVDIVTREALGLTCRIQSSRLRIFSGEVVLEGVELVPLGRDEPLARLGHADLEVSWSELPKIVVHRLSVDDLEVRLRRRSDGSVPALAAFLGSKAPAPGQAAPPAKAKTKTPPRVLLEATRIQHVRVDWEDEAISPPLRTHVELDLRADNLATWDRGEAARLALRLAAPGILDTFRLDAGQVVLGGGGRAFDLLLAVEGHPQALAPYLAPRAEAAAQTVALELEGRLVVRPSSLEEGTRTADLALEHASLRADGDEIGFDRVLASLSSLGPSGVRVASVAVERPHASLARRADGALLVAGLALPDRPAPAPASSTASAASPRTVSAVTSGSGWPFAIPVAVDAVSVHGGRFAFHDLAARRPIDLEARDLEVAVRGLAWDSVGTRRPASLEASVAVPGIAEQVALVGTAVPFGAERTVALDVAAHGIGGEALLPYLSRVGLEGSLGHGELGAHVTAAARPAASGELEISGEVARLVLADAAGREVLGVDSVAVAGASLDPRTRRLDLGSVSVVRPRASLVRGSSGEVEGLGLRTRAPEADPVAAALALARASRPEPATPPLIDYLHVRTLSIQGLAARFHDAALEPALDLALEDGRLELEGVAMVASGSSSPRPAPGHVHASARLTPGPGRFSLEAEVAPDPAAPIVSGSFVASELTARPLAPYLALRGIEPLLEHGELAARFGASARVSGLSLSHVALALTGVRLAAGDDELAAMDVLDLSGARLDARTRSLDLGAVTVEGLRARASRDRSGGVAALGLRFRSRPPAPAPDAAPEPSPDEPAPLPHLRWGELALRGGRVVWTDEAVEPAARLALDQVALTVGARHLDQEAQGEVPPLHEPAPFTLHAALEGAVGSLDASGQLFPSLRAPVFHAHVGARGVTLASLAPYLAGSGWAPALADGDLSLELEGSAALGRGETHASVALRDVVARDGKEEILGLDRAELGLRVDRASRGVQVSLAQIERPRLLVARTAAGELALLGLARRPRPVPDAAAGDVASVRSASRPLDLAIQAASVADLTVRWRDAQKGVALDLVHGTVELGAARLGAGGEPGTLRAHADVPGLGSLDLSGTALLDRDAPTLDLFLRLSHVAGSRVAPYLAPRAEPLLVDGTLRARIHAEAGPCSQGGRRLAFSVSDLALEDTGRSWLTFSSLRVSVPRIDPEGRVYAVSDLALEGVEGAGERLEDGRVSLLGLAWKPGAGPAAPPPPPRDPNQELPDATDAPPLPLVTVQQAHVLVRKVSFVDRASAAGPDAPPPFVLTEAGLALVQPIILNLDDPTTTAVDVEAHGKLAPAVRSGIVFAHVIPFDAEPQVALSLDVDGISGPAILERLPRAAARWDPSSVTDGLVKGTLSVVLKRCRRRIDQVLGDPLAAPLALEVTASGEARSTPDGPVLLGADELLLDLAQLDLATGETRARALEVVNPRLRLRREEGGVRFLDVVRKTPPAGSAAPEPSPGPATAGGSGSPSPEVRVDRVSITDGDIVLEDLAVQPQSSAQLGGLEVEVLGLSSRALREHRPVRVRFGAKGGALFDELAARGTLTFSPRIEGDVDVQLAGLKLAPLSGYTYRAWRLGIREGRLDAESRLRFRYGRLQSTTHLQLAQAQVFEPSGGSTISQKMSPMSVGSALALLKDDDEIVAFDIPYRQEFDENLHTIGQEVDGGALVAEALLSTLKGAGAKVLGGFESIGSAIKGATMGKGGGERGTRTIEFAVQDERVGAAAEAELEALAKVLASDSSLRATLKAEVGREDEARSKRLASPTHEERRDLIARLEARRARLDRRRADADALVRAALLSSSPEAVGSARSRYAEARRALLELDRALDDLYDQEREGSDRGGERRTRQVEESLCEGRVEAVRAYLVAHGVPLERIRALRPKTKVADETPAAGRVLVDVGVREK